jgi:hypothetical protein
MLKNRIRDIYYTIKAVRSVRSGFVELQCRNSFGNWTSADEEYCYEQPYYVCALFRNGRHLPLPLVLGDKSEYPLQNAVLNRLRRKGLLRQAEIACQEYINRYENPESDKYQDEIYNTPVLVSFKKQVVGTALEIGEMLGNLADSEKVIEAIANDIPDPETNILEVDGLRIIVLDIVEEEKGA